MDGMTDGWAIYGKELEPAIQRNIVQKLLPLGQAIEWQDEGYKLGLIPNLHSLIPYSLEARKPVFDCKSGDGLRGAHIKKASDSKDHFEQVVQVIKAAAQGQYG